MSGSSKVIEERLQHLERHLEQENPVLLSTVQSFRTIDQVARRMGLFDQGDSFATTIPWWPLVSILGTFSAGKSSFINHYLGTKLQRSGNQAVDEKFTVLCYSHETTPHALPGVALDSDPRFPFYKISSEIEKVSQGEGSRIDAYLQLKTCPSEELRGKIVIDSPGFDADAQRTSTLRITEHIIDLSDLVLVFFDARHPEPGAMRDTLDHLVTSTINRPDSGKFMYILNQLDTTAREDNPEEVVAAWQRALGERGLTAGRFYTIYNKEAAMPIDDPALRRRFESKREEDIGEIHGRMQRVEIERAYRIVGALEKTARDLEDQVVPILQEAVTHWRKRVITGDVIAVAAIVAGFLAVTINQGLWNGYQLQAAWWQWISASTEGLIGLGIALAVIAGVLHFSVRRLAARSLHGWVRKRAAALGDRGDLVRAFICNTKPWHSIFRKKPVGWSQRNRRKLQGVIEDTDRYVQALNDRFTNPGGRAGTADAPVPLSDRGTVATATPGGATAETAAATPEAETPR